ncbi:phosphatidylethanolamine-binding protein [Elsinoe ampelina]|uniref:Large ribosomal subunit protein mL38 n=1 Tax=Elsinoe ampelina TaxID=302913 RepID=A0A6A6GAF4_9PEZI|nr:phosphatidylethanolamine-binding protein [Elsinoe ampelina]
MSLSRSGWRCLRCTRLSESSLSAAGYAQARQLSYTSARSEEVQTDPSSSSKPLLDPALVHTPRLERKLLRETNQTPIGSRRRRAALRNAQQQLPFEQLPYQCFQEARKILAEDRAEKLEAIESTRARIERVKAQQVDAQNIGSKERNLISLEQRLEKLKVLADINDPLVKRNFEDGTGDLNKPVYRHLAEQKWRSYTRAVNVQRIEQFHLVPDILQALDPVVQVDVLFGKRKVDPGEYIESYTSERVPSINIQSFSKEPRLVTVACINPDVPNVAKDGFDFRCHFLAHNIEITPTQPLIHLGALAEDQTVLPWLPAYNQKGAPYHRMSFFVLEQPEGLKLDVQATKKKAKREGFALRSIVDRHRLKPIGGTLFRSQWDAGTAQIMKKLGIPGHDVEFKRMKIEPLPYKKLPGSRYR